MLICRYNKVKTTNVSLKERKHIMNKENHNQEKDWLGKYGRMLRDYFRSENPVLYLKMQKEKTLRQFLLDRENRFYDQMIEYEKKGMNRIEAREVAWEEFITLPEDEEIQPQPLN